MSEYFKKCLSLLSNNVKYVIKICQKFRSLIRNCIFRNHLHLFDDQVCQMSDTISAFRALHRKLHFELLFIDYLWMETFHTNILFLCLWLVVWDKMTKTERSKWHLYSAPMSSCLGSNDENGKEQTASLY